MVIKVKRLVKKSYTENSQDEILLDSLIMLSEQNNDFIDELLDYCEQVGYLYVSTEQDSNDEITTSNIYKELTEKIKSGEMLPFIKPYLTRKLPGLTSDISTEVLNSFFEFITRKFENDIFDIANCIYYECR